MSKSAERARERYRENLKAHSKRVTKRCASLEGLQSRADTTRRDCEVELFYQSEVYQALTQNYAFDLTVETINGVYCEVFTPKSGVPVENNDKVLLNVHGGSCMYGSRTTSHLESAPIAVEGKIKVVSVDYRLAPDHQFPAASDDLMAVYQSLLERYSPSNIGIYGSSSGANIIAQALVELQLQGCAKPAAVGLFFGSASAWQGDSMHWGGALAGSDLIDYVESIPYYSESGLDDPRVTPGNDDRLLEQFPPALLMSASRDFALSSVIHTHSRLTALGVKAELYVWEGLEHTFINNSELPESQEAYRVIVDYFTRMLGDGGKP